MSQRQTLLYRARGLWALMVYRARTSTVPGFKVGDRVTLVGEITALEQMEDSHALRITIAPLEEITSGPVEKGELPSE